MHMSHVNDVDLIKSENQVKLLYNDDICQQGYYDL